MAYKCGKLTGPDQSLIQRWALGYYQFNEDRKSKTAHFEVERLLHYILKATDPKFYQAAFPTPEANDPDLVPGHSYGVDDLEGFERIIQSLDQLRTRSQAELDNEAEWSEWSTPSGRSRR